MGKLIKLGLISLVIMGMVGCSMTPTVKEKISETDEKAQAYQQKQSQQSVNVWIPSKVIYPKKDQRNPYIERLEAKEYTLRGYYDEINNLSSKIAEITRIPVIVEQGITNQTQLAGTSATSTSSGTTGAVSSTSSSTNLTKLPFSYSGDLKGLLDLAASRFNVEWEWLDGGQKIRFYKVKTKTYRIAALAGDSTFVSTVSKSASDSASQLETGYNFSELSVWSNIEDAIEAMLSDNGQVVVTPAVGTVTVTDTPINLKPVDDYIAQINESLLKQVLVNVRILSVDISDSESYGLNWDLIYSSLSNQVSGGLTTAISPVASSSELALNIIGNGNWSGSSAFIQALSKQGKVSQVTSNSLTTLNQQPVPIQVGNEQSYLASSETTIDNGQSTTALQPDVISTGFSMNFVPHILTGDELLIQFGIDISDLISLDSVTSGNSTIQTPNKATRNFLQRVKLKSGETLVVSGFEQAKSSSDRQGTAKSEWLSWLGAGVQNDDGRTTLVVLIQPVILD